ncbi:LANO_0G10044g1_1 [Lachancea nothofagi CBS 11611]|uniref:LANO_0G10044g1_1 n=1 Tax=Lachancea nothofagi CBS 11611 TaxID=1266666 RepID=A0A1G4KJ53_9SACH|nr:LANO_0G10044g1_1 [Lachancea nothofagi CBS 11611]
MFARFPFRASNQLAKNCRVWRSSRPLRFNSTATLDSFVTPSEIINAQNSLNIGITQRAANRLAQISQDSGEALRVCVESGGCHGFQYRLTLIPRDQIKLDAFNASDSAKPADTQENEDSFEEDDDDFESNQDVVFVLPDNGGQVVIDEKSLKVLDKTTLTYTTELIGSTFKITGGNMKNSCGCGSSFDVEM